jgi:uncharacterized protein with NRDE domain
MCLIALSHRASARFPFVLAANRDEDYLRPTDDAHFWVDALDVLGGRDALHGGSWLAVSRGGRFAAVTNLRGAAQRSRSRGALVSAFVTGTVEVHEYAAEVARHAEEYSGFHLLAGTIGGEAMYIAPHEKRVLAPGIYSVSNAPAGEQWPKMELAVAAMTSAVALDDPIDDLLTFLSTSHGGAVESEAFIAGDRYGTRSSTVIAATANELVFVEQSYARGGAAQGEPRRFRVARE